MKLLLSIAFAVVSILLAAFFVNEALIEGELGVLSGSILVAGAVVAGLILAGRGAYDARPHLVTNLVLAVSSTLISYAAVDVLGGWVFLRQYPTPVVADPHIHHRFLPDTTFLNAKKPDYLHTQTVNNLGLRGDDVSATKPRGTYRIVMLGDSFTMGSGVEDDQTFSHLVEEELARHASVPVEVINGGVDSYAPILSYLLLKRTLLDVEPDLVVLNLDMSDLTQEQAYRSLATYDEDDTPVGVNGVGAFMARTSSLNKRVRFWISRNLLVSRVILGKLEEAFDVADRVEDVVVLASPRLVKHTLQSDIKDRTAEWEDLFASLAMIRDLCADNGIGFLLTAYPWGHQIGDSEWVPGRFTFMARTDRPSRRTEEIIESMAAREGIEFFSLFPAFRAYAGSDNLYYERDMHWTRHGHTLTAETLAPRLLEIVEESRDRPAGRLPPARRPHAGMRVAH